jgi:hypothetical protein
MVQDPPGAERAIIEGPVGAALGVALVPEAPGRPLVPRDGTQTRHDR